MGLRAILEPTCQELRVLRIGRTPAKRPVVEFQLGFRVRYSGRIPCCNWGISSAWQNCPFELTARAIDAPPGIPAGIHQDTIILPAQELSKNVYFGVNVEPGVSRAEFVHAILNVTCLYRAVGENIISVGRSVRLGDVTTLEWLYHDIEEAAAASGFDALQEK